MQNYPIDINVIQKGAVILPEKLEYILGEKRGTQAYLLGVLNFRTQIEQMLIDAGRTQLTLKIEKEALRILTDEQAAKYNDKQFNSLLRRSARRVVLQMSVDVSQLDDATRREHSRKCLINGKMLQAASTVRKQFKLKPHKRVTPKLT